MLWKLSLKNIQKSFKDYAIYFFTLILGVAIFYVFNAIDSQTVMLNVTSSTRDIIKLMTNMLSGISVFISFILGFLIIYASRFLIKRRNKEFGIYLTLGMSKRKISGILFLETLFIGIISLIIGVFLGTFLSQFMSLLVANLFDADMTKFTFIFSKSACLKTLIYFGITYILVMIFNTININKCKLIDLLSSFKKSEKVKLKNPYICLIIFIIATLILGIAYYLVTIGFDKLTSAEDIFIPIIMGAIGTFLIFWSLSGLILKIVKSMKKLYYKKLNSFILRQFSSKINTTIFSMTIICLMLFVTICVLSSALSIRNSMTANTKSLVPADVDILKGVVNNDLNVLALLQINNYDYQNKFKEIIEYDIYHDNNLTLEKSFGDQFTIIKKEFPLLTYDTLEDIMTLSDYNKVAKFYHHPTFDLKDNEYLIIADFKSMVEIRNKILKKQVPITINNKEYVSKYSECQNGFVNIAANHSNSGIIVVPDTAITSEMKITNGILANYKEQNKDKRVVLDQELNKFMINLYQNDNSLSIRVNTKLDIIEASVGLGALVTFIGLYLGIIFLISSAAILALKELSESSDNKIRFQMLRNLGADEKLINQALFRQIAIFFIFPLLLACIHSIFGIMFSNQILQIFGDDELLPSIIMTAIFIVIIYGGYFLITYYCSKNIIKEK